MRQLLAELERVIDGGLPCAVCTVVATRGSTPQKPGATLLVFADGTQAGTLGGGCVEAEVRQRALHSLAANCESELHSFTLDDDFGWDDGLICGGRMTILATPVVGSAREYFRELCQLVGSGHGCTEVVALNGHRGGAAPGSRYLFNSSNKLVAHFGSPINEHINCGDLSQQPRPSVEDGLARLPTRSRITLLIVGGGHVGQAVARLAADCEFDVWVLDDRETFANEEKFPHAKRRMVGDIGKALLDLKPQITPSTYCLVVTRGHNHDEEALFHCVTTPAGYVGMIGSKRKVRLVFEELKDKGIGDDALARVRAPVGIEIGSQTVSEIAVSIVAELIERRNLGVRD